MEKINVTNRSTSFLSYPVAGKPSMPITGKKSMIERRSADPSSAAPKGERYPIPSFFEYRIRIKDFDTL
ncbi:MAG: hypothetical protein ACM3VS_13890 [Candidatus Dadabacteria bacterium]